MLYFICGLLLSSWSSSSDAIFLQTRSAWETEVANRSLVFVEETFNAFPGIFRNSQIGR